MNIGIAGNGKIVSEMLEAVKQIEGISVTAICSRVQSKAKAQLIADKYEIKKVYTDYGEMLKDDEIDFIYVAVINSQHYNYAKQALEAGKNVICEKPFTISAKETADLINLAREKKLFLFEAITVLYASNFKYIKEHLPEIGQLRYVHANYAQYSSRYDRYLKQEVAPAFDPKMAGGALYDLNIYNLHFAVGLFGEPKDITYRANFGFNGVDTSGTALLDYDEFTVVCSASKDSESVSGITFQAEKGHMELIKAPNECAMVHTHRKQRGFSPQITSKERYNHRMVDEFIAFKEIFEQKDYTACYENLKHTQTVMNVLEKACNSANLNIEI